MQLWPALPRVKRLSETLSAPGGIVRRADPDRFFTVLFAPPAQREALFTLYAFNVELSRASMVASEPTLALIRLHWWREVIDGARKAHEVATPLSALLAGGVLDPADLRPLVDAREAETEEIATVAAWRDYLLAGAGGLAVAAGRVLGVPGHAGLRLLGAAYGAAGVLRSVPTRGASLLPTEQPDVASLADVGRGLLAEARAFPVPKPARAAALPGVLARRDLRHPGDPAPRGLGDRLAVMAAMATGRF